jgi:hypothetical protein
VKYVTAERHDFRSVLRENWMLRIELSRWCLGVFGRREGMVLPHAIHVAAERGRFRGGLRENWVVKIELSQWCKG